MIGVHGSLLVVGDQTCYLYGPAEGGKSCHFSAKLLTALVWASGGANGEEGEKAVSWRRVLYSAAPVSESHSERPKMAGQTGSPAPQSPAGAALRVHLLGGFRVVVGDRVLDEAN